MGREFDKSQKLKSILIAAVVMFFGILIFKFIPMEFFGNDVKFDASLHLTIAIFLLYVGWYFFDYNKNWKLFYLLFSFAVVIIVSVQRIYVGAHNDIGLIIALIISFFAIVISRWKYFRKRILF